MMFKKWPDLDPDEKADYDIDWSSKSGVDATNPIVAITADIVAGDGLGSLTIMTGAKAPSYSGTVSKVWLTGGTLGEKCRIKQHATFTNGQELDETREILIRAK